VIAKPRLRDFWTKYRNAETPLKTWWKIVRKARWANIQDVRLPFPHADAVELKCGLVVTVFNIGGNKYRLVTTIAYEYHTVYIKAVLTHEQYDSQRWKVQLCNE
jgi:mRNA interferase HigB